MVSVEYPGDICGCPKPHTARYACAECWNKINTEHNRVTALENALFDLASETFSYLCGNNDAHTDPLREAAQRAKVLLKNAPTPKD